MKGRSFWLRLLTVALLGCLFTATGCYYRDGYGHGDYDSHHYGGHHGHGHGHH